MEFKIGDKVRFLDQVGEGEVIGIVDNNTVTVLDGTGMDFDFLKSKLVLSGSRMNDHRSYDQKPIQKEESSVKEYKAFNDDSVNHIDIHAHRLISNPEGYSQDYIVDMQLNEVKKAVRRSIQKKAKSLVVIHGEGKSVVKKKVRRLLHELEEVKEVQDASYEKFGQGATEAFF